MMDELTFMLSVRHGRELAHALDLGKPGEDYSGNPDLVPPSHGHEANVVTSKCSDPPSPFGQPVIMHRPVIDLDVPHTYVPSSTPGHGHLYLDVDLTWAKYEALLEHLQDLGIIQPGFLLSAKANKASAVRLPWLRKPEVPGDSSELA